MTISPVSCHLASGESPVVTEKKRKKRRQSNIPKIARVASTKTRRPYFEQEFDAWETEAAADPPPQIDGHLMDEEIAQSEQSDQLIALVEQIATGARGEGNGAADAMMDLTQAATTILNLADDLACNAPQTRQGQICGEFLAKLTRALVSRRKALSKCNPAYCDKIKALFSKKDLRLRGAAETQLAFEALSYFSGVYQTALVAQHLKGCTLSKEKKLVLKHEKVFSSEEPLLKGEADAAFKELIRPWLIDHEGEKFRENCLDLYKQSWRTVVISQRRKSHNSPS